MDILNYRVVELNKETKEIIEVDNVVCLHAENCQDRLIDINKKVRNSERQFVLGDNETLRLMGYLK